MNRGDKGKRPLKGRGHLPQGELIALGSKGPIKTPDVGELKPLPPLKTLASSSSKKPSTSLPDRKRDCPSPLQPLRLAKRAKTSSPHSPSVSIDIESSLKSPTGSPLPPVAPIEVSAEELEGKVIKAEENDDRAQLDGYIMGALKILRGNRSKPDPGMYLSLFCLVKRRPYLFRSQRVVEFLTSLLKRDSSVNLKGARPNPAIPIITCNILLCAFQDVQDWPEGFIKVFVEDSLGDRAWIENEKCRTFVDNLLTAFCTKLPPRNTVPAAVEGTKLESVAEGSTSVPKLGKTEEDEIFFKNVECKESISPEPEKVFNRYELASTQENLQSYVVDLIRDQLTRRQLVDNTTRNLLRLMSSACGISEVRLLSSQRLEVWLLNPKLNRPAQELLMSVALNCNTHSMEDVEVISNVIKMRLKTKQLAAHYITCVRIMVEQHEDNLGTLIKHIIYNELSQTRNPNNMSLLNVLFQYDPENAAQNLASVFQDLLMNKEDYLRAVRALLREIVRALRHDLDFVALCRGLMTERKDSTFQELESSVKERMFASLTDMITVTTLLSVTPTVRDAILSFKRGDFRDVKVLQEFQKNVATVQQDMTLWLHTIVPHMFPISSTNYQQSLSKVLFMEPPESYSSKDSWPSESERSFLMSVISDVPVMDDTLTRVTVIGLSPELPLDAAKALKLVETLVQRAAAVKSGVHPMELNRLRFIDAVLDLCVYHYPPNIQLPAGYSPPSLAIANLYWTGWIVILIVAAFNPENIGKTVWHRYPTMRCLMEMVMTNNFVFPPPTMVENGEKLEELQSIESQLSAAEKEDILLFETHLAAATTGKTITEDSSLLVSQLISMVPKGPARKPPQYAIEQLKTLNATVGIGKLFCRCRSPDFLLDIIQRQGAAQSRPWLADLVLSSQESLDGLPVQCLCEFLLLQPPQSEPGEGELDEKSEKQKETIKQVLSRLQLLLFGSEASHESTSEALECFMYRLHSRPTKERDAAVRALSLIFSFNVEDGDSSRETYSWLLDSIPTLPYFDAVLSSLSSSLRKACTEELDFQRLQAYIIFLSKYSVDYVEDVSMDLARVVLERPTVLKNILLKDTRIASDTHLALLKVFSSVLTRALETSSANFPWDERQDLIYVRWSADTMHDGKAATLGVYIVHATMVLMTFGAPHEDRTLFDWLLNTWCPAKGSIKTFLPDSGDEIALLPDWLRLKMICSDVQRLVDKAFSDIEPAQLIVFVQSFGIPVANTSKILQHLDRAAEENPSWMSEIIIDKNYMLQLVGVHRSRGAVGGRRFCDLLSDESVESPGKPFKEQRITPMRSSRLSAENDEPMAVDGGQPSERITDLIFKIFPFGSHRKTFSARGQTHYGFQLQKILSQETAHLHKGVDISQTMAEQFIKTLTKILSSEDGSSFSKVFFDSPKFSHPFLRMLIARETILQKQGDYSSFPQLMDLLSQQKAANGPVATLVNKYHQQPRSRRLQNRTEVSLEVIRQYVRRIQCGESISDNEVKEIISGLKNPLNQNIRPSELMCVLSWLQSSRSPLLVEFLRSLISLLLARTAQDPSTAETNHFIQDMIGLLRDDVRSRATNGAIIDWLPVLDPDIVNICPLKQRQLLFGLRDPVKGSGVSEGHVENKGDHEVSQGLLLLVLLTHSGSWDNLQDSLDWLLSQNRDTTRVDPTAALRFVECCLSIPHLWQGRDTKSAKGIETSITADNSEGEILNLSRDQLRCIVMYIFMEAERIAKKPEISGGSEVNALLEKRVSLLLRCSKGKERNLCSIAERLQSDTSWSKELRQQFLLHLYLRLPELISWLKDTDSLFNLSFAAKANFGKFDGFFHRMISILSECQSGKAWEDRVSGVVLLCRKMASLHPAHILRYLPMISSLLRGRTHLTSKEFYNQNHFLFFTHILGLLDSLRPHIFDSSQFIQDGLLDALDTFLDLVQSQCIKEKERTGVVAKLVEFLQHFLTHNPRDAFEYLRTKTDFLEDLLIEHAELSSLKSLLAVLAVPRTLGRDQSRSTSDDECSRRRDELVPSSLLAMTPVTSPWTQGQIDPFLQRIGPNQPMSEILQVLNDLDEASKRKVGILQFFLHDLARLAKHVNEACRAKAHSLITRHLKQNPRDARLIVDCYLECLSSTDPEVVLSAAKVLPEIAVLSAEFADQLLEKAFFASTQKLPEVGSHVTRTLQLLNME